MSRKPRVTLNDEVQSLIDNSNTHPAVLVAKLLTDALARKYDTQALSLLRRREVLIKELHDAVHNGAHPCNLNYYWDHGFDITVNFGVPNKNQSVGLGRLSQVEEFFKTLDNSAPRSAGDGAHRLLALKIFNTGPAFYMFAHALFTDGGNTVLNKQLNQYRKPWDLSQAEFGFGLSFTALSFKNKEPRARNNHNASGTLRIDLTNVRTDLFRTLEKIAEDEFELLKQMMADTQLLAEQAFRVRGLEKIIKRIPDVLEHPDFKLLLGYDVNPQQERIDFINRTLTGEALLNPSL